MNEEIKQATEQIIKEMLTESTGKALMDSGDAYGRHWEDNQKNGIKTGYQICDFYRDDEEQTCELIPTIPIFDVLSENLQYTDKCKYLESFLPSDIDGQLPLFWIEEEVEQGIIYNTLNDLINNQCLNQFISFDLIDANFQLLGSTINYANNLLLNLHPTIFEENTHTGTSVSNTYNGEDFLSQGYMYIFFEYEDDPYIAISIHNGCDIRGGYTNVHIFDVGYEDDFITAQNEASIDCLHTDGEIHICESGYHIYGSIAEEYYSHLEQKDVDKHYVYEHTYVDENKQLRCKECNGLITCSSLVY